MPTILIVDDEPGIRMLLGEVLQRDGYATIDAATGLEGVAAFEAQRPDLVLCDVSLPELDGIGVLERIKALDPAAAVVVMTGQSSTELAIRAMALGASEYLVKPLQLKRAIGVVRQILESAQSVGPVAERDEPGAPAGESQLIGRTEAMYEVFKLIGRVAGQPSTVLILGESGTGKEMVAQAIHGHGPRRAGPFVAVNCAAIPDALLESELFGHEKGAFTGADRQRIGKFELARDGTLFLDEIGDMSPLTQAKLLRVLQDQEFHRLGGRDPVRTNARILAATNRDLRADVASGRFREDLFYRLSVVTIRLPPLRERRDDIPALAAAFLRRSARNLRRAVRGIAPSALELLRAYHWPGNIRELANVVEQAVLQAPGPTLLPSQFAGLVPEDGEAGEAERPGLFDAAAVRAYVVDRIAAGEVSILQPLLAAYEDVVISAALAHCEGNVSRAAQHLGVHRVTLKSKLHDCREAASS